MFNTRGALRTFTTELLVVNYFPKKPPQMFDWVLNTPLNMRTNFFPDFCKLENSSYMENTSF